MNTLKKIKSYWNDLQSIHSDWGLGMLYKLRLKPLWIHYIINGGKGDRLDLEFKALILLMIIRNSSISINIKKLTKLLLVRPLLFGYVGGKGKNKCQN